MNWFGGFNMGMPMGMGRNFSVSLKAHSAPFYANADVEKINEINFGGKILLPSSALDALVRLNIQYPMLFKLSNTRNGLTSHCGVLEFSADEGTAYLPQWMMAQLHIDEGQLLQVESASLPKASFARLKPQNLGFLDISNPRAVLEVELRKFACLSVNDRIAVRYNDQTLEFLVLELKPGRAVCIIECDVNLEFDAPEGYVDEAEKRKYEKTVKPPAPPMAVDDIPAKPSTTFQAFQGSGARLDGKQRKPRTESTSSMAGLSEAVTTLPQVRAREDYVPGTLHFPRYDYKCRIEMEKELKERAAGGKSEFSSFEGTGKALRVRK